MRVSFQPGFTVHAITVASDGSGLALGPAMEPIEREWVDQVGGRRIVFPYSAKVYEIAEGTIIGTVLPRDLPTYYRVQDADVVRLTLPEAFTALDAEGYVRWAFEREVESFNRACGFRRTQKGHKYQVDDGFVYGPRWVVVDQVQGAFYWLRAATWDELIEARVDPRVPVGEIGAARLPEAV